MTDTTQQAADILMAVRKGGPRVAGLGAAAPQTEAGAFAVQAEILKRLGTRIGGWKCAAPPGKPTSAAMLDAAFIRPASASQLCSAAAQLAGPPCTSPR